jgi:hypothetical protein
VLRGEENGIGTDPTGSTFFGVVSGIVGRIGHGSQCDSIPVRAARAVDNRGNPVKISSVRLAKRIAEKFGGTYDSAQCRTLQILL